MSAIISEAVKAPEKGLYVYLGLEVKRVEAVPEKGNESKRKVLPEVEVTAPRYKPVKKIGEVEVTAKKYQPVKKIGEVTVYGKKSAKKTAKFGTMIKSSSKKK